MAGSKPKDTPTAGAPGEAAEDHLILVKVNKDLNADAATSSDGKNYAEGEAVSKNYFEEVLAKDVDREGVRLFYAGGKA